MNKLPTDPRLPQVSFDINYLQRLNSRLYELLRDIANAHNSLITDREAYTVTTSSTLDPDDDVVLVDTTLGNITITLPLITDTMIYTKREHQIVKTVAANTITVSPSGADTINGSASASLVTQWTAIRYRATTGNWVAI